MDDSSAPIFTQAKMEYTSQLIDVLTPQLFDGIKSIYDEAITMNRVNKSQSLLSLFRSYLEKVPSWSNEIIENETDRIISPPPCQGSLASSNSCRPIKHPIPVGPNIL